MGWGARLAASSPRTRATKYPAGSSPPTAGGRAGPLRRGGRAGAFAGLAFLAGAFFAGSWLRVLLRRGFFAGPFVAGAFLAGDLRLPWRLPWARPSRGLRGLLRRGLPAGLLRRHGARRKGLPRRRVKRHVEESPPRPMSPGRDIVVPAGRVPGTGRPANVKGLRGPPESRKPRTWNPSPSAGFAATRTCQETPAPRRAVPAPGPAPWPWSRRSGTRRPDRPIRWWAPPSGASGWCGRSGAGEWAPSTWPSTRSSAAGSPSSSCTSRWPPARTWSRASTTRPGR